MNDPDFDKPNAHRSYLIERSKKGLAWQTINGDYSAIKMLYTKVLNRDRDMKKIPRPRIEKFLPTVLSQDQIKQLIDGYISANRATHIGQTVPFISAQRVPLVSVKPCHRGCGQESD